MKKISDPSRTVYLDCDIDSPQSIVTSARIEDGNSAGEFKILVADDSPMYRKLLQDTLAREGYAVVLAEDGRQARNALSEHHPPLVITDWEMPDTTGIDLCKQIRLTENFYTYIILLTGKAEKEKIIEGLAAGADDYLTKPVHSGELLARVGVGRRVSELHRQIQAKNILLEELSLTDPLTGLPNRRAIEPWANREISGAMRHGFPFWVVMADLDHFKSVNDTYGHEAGDIVLKRFAELLKTNTRASNMCARLGGEEFIVVLTHINSAGVKIAIERIRSQFEKQTFNFGGASLRVTASFGIAGLGNAPSNLEQLLRVADAAVYRAKENGRNRAECAL
ncbi:MAG: diguanylate cyclase [Candidatus Sulfotelmatobacter sp.]